MTVYTPITEKNFGIKWRKKLLRFLEKYLCKQLPFDQTAFISEM